MKLDINTTKVQGAGFEAVSDFRVAMNAKAFKVLSDQLYKDKIGSIVRELSCNAFDSHIAAGCPEVPFEIHLPDAFEPYFSIRDFGTGISHEDIIRIYTTYFESTKDDANDEVGAFGLGSKTPFSYTDSFTVISINNGIKTMYNAHMSEGLPKMVQYGESEPTDEPDGLEVNVSVETVDYKAFADAVKRQLKFFEVKPKVSNATLEWDNYEPILEVPGFKYLKITNAPTYGGKYSPSAGLFVKQGPIGYPVDFDIIEQYLNSNGKRGDKFYNYLKGIDRGYTNCIMIDMPIGTVEVTASREGISYTDVTIRNILSKMTTIGSAIASDVERSLDKAYNDLSPLEFVQHFCDLDAYFKSTIKVEDLNKKYPKFTFANKHYSTDFAVPKFRMDSKFAGITIRKYSRDWRGSKFKLGSTMVYRLDEDTDTHFDLPVEYFQRDKIYVKDLNQGFVARMAEDATSNSLIMIEVPTGVTLDEIINVIGDGVEFVPVSELDAPTRMSVSRDGHSITGGRKRAWFDLRRNHYNHHCFMDDKTLYALNADQVFTEQDFDDVVDAGKTYVYFVTHNNKVLSDLNNTGLDYKRLAMFTDWIIETHGHIVIGLAKNDVNKVSKKGDFVHIVDLWKAKQKDYYDSVWTQFVNFSTNAYYAIMTKYLVDGSSSFYNNRNSGSIKTMLKFLGECGVDTSKLGEQQQFLEKYIPTNTTLDYSFHKLLSEVLTNGKKGLVEEINDIYLDGRGASKYPDVTPSIEHFELLLRKAGVKLDHRYSEFVKDLKTAVLDNIGELIKKVVISEGSVNLNNFVFRCPITHDEILSTEELVDKL